MRYLNQTQNSLTKLYSLIGTIVGLFFVFFLFLKIQNFVLNLDKYGRWVAASVGCFNPTQDYLTGLVLAIVVSVLLLFFPMNRKLKYFLLGGWIFRLITIFIIMPYYEGHYSILDAYGYVMMGAYNYSHSLLQALSFEIGKGTYNIGKFCGLIYYFIPFSWYGTKVIFSTIGLLGVILFFKGFQKIHPKTNLPLIFGILLFHPSITFWSSIIGKDPIMFFFIGIYFYGVMSFIVSGKSNKLFIAILGSSLMLFIRLWMTSITIMALAIYLTISLKSSKKALYLPILLLLGGLAITMFFSFFGIESLGDLVDKADRISKGWAHGGSALEVPNITSLPILIMFLPKAMFATLFRPLLFEIRNAFGWVAGIENTTMLLAFSYAIYKLKKTHFNDPAFKMAFIYSIIWTTIYAIPCYQNLGTAERYRLQVLPFILMIIITPFVLKDQKSINFFSPPTGYAPPHLSNHA